MTSGRRPLRTRRPAGPPASDAAFEALYRQEVASIIAIAAALTGSRETGAELAHEALLRAYRDWPTIAAMDRPGAWLRRVVVNLATDAHRRRVRERRALQLLDARPRPASPSATDDAFWVAVRSLPERQRVAVALYHLDDRSVESVADVQGVTVGTVKASLFAARRTLATLLGAQEVGDGRPR